MYNFFFVINYDNNKNERVSVIFKSWSENQENTRR